MGKMKMKIRAEDRNGVDPGYDIIVDLTAWGFPTSKATSTVGQVLSK